MSNTEWRAVTGYEGLYEVSSGSAARQRLDQSGWGVFAAGHSPRERNQMMGQVTT